MDCCLGVQRVISLSVCLEQCVLFFISIIIIVVLFHLFQFTDVYNYSACTVEIVFALVPCAYASHHVNKTKYAKAFFPVTHVI